MWRGNGERQAAQSVAPKGVFYVLSAPLSVSSNGHQFPLIQRDRSVVLFTSDRFLLPVFRSMTILVERQFLICVIGCRLPDAEVIVHAGAAFCCWFIGNWRPLYDHFERVKWSSNERQLPMQLPLVWTPWTMDHVFYAGRRSGLNHSIVTDFFKTLGLTAHLFTWSSISKDPEFTS